MAKFKYNALKEGNKIVYGEIEAIDSREARAKIRDLGFIPTKVYVEGLQEQNYVTTESKNFSIRLKLSEKILFTSELEVLLSSGISILEALKTLENNSPNIKIKGICSTLQKSIISGCTLAESFEKYYSETFGHVFIGLVKTGENAGELEKTLSRMLILFRKQEDIRDKIINASTYPTVLIVMMLGLLILFSKFVFPAFAGVIFNNGGELPFMAQMLVDICSFVDNFWWLIIMGICGGVYSIISIFKNYNFKKYFDEFVLKIPVISDFVTYINLSNFMTVLYIAYEAGVPILSALDLSNKTVGNIKIKDKIKNAISRMKNGVGFSDAFRSACVIPESLLSMVSAGEISGTMGKMFRDCANVIDKKIDMVLKTLSKLFEPTVVLLLGGVVLFIVVAFYQMYIGMLGSLF